MSLNTHSTPRGSFSIHTLNSMVEIAKKDVQRIEANMASARAAGTTTTHWEERLRQSTVVLSAAQREMQHFSAPNPHA